MFNTHFIFSRNIEYLRKKKKRETQEQSALSIGVKTKRFQAWEEGRGLPPLPLMIRICEHFEYFDIYSLIKTDIRKK